MEGEVSDRLIDGASPAQVPLPARISNYPAHVRQDRPILQPGSFDAKLSARPQNSKWRSDIDGLRALAVVPVVIFHVAQSFLRGGYAGVDIFFVISGYLISRNIFTELSNGRFRLAHFYERRLRRIFPVYALVLFTVLVFVFIYDLPSTTRSFAASLIAAIGSVTNIYFWSTTSYFGQPAENLPLLHTWSLAVEEQFYFVFPILVSVAFHFKRLRLPALIAGLIALSLALSAYGAFAYASATFYLLPTRAWELLFGTFLALGALPRLRSGAARNAASLVGFALIVISFLLLTPYTPFPGLAALPPCLGAALILYAGETGETWVSRLLSCRPVVFVGLISYSLYLWHWPILVLQRNNMLFFTTDSKLVERIAVIGLSFAFATLSWLIVERTTRNRRLLPTKALVLGSVLTGSGLVAAGLTLWATNGLPGRFKPEAVKVANYLDYDQTAQFREGKCFLSNSAAFSTFDKELCLPNLPNRANYLLIGDSHAAALADGLRTVFPGVNLLQVTGVECPPLPLPRPATSRACSQLHDMMLNELPASRTIAKVFIAARWAAGRLDPVLGWDPNWLDDLKRMVDAFRARGIAVIVVGPNPEFRSPLPGLLALSIQHDDATLAEHAVNTATFKIDQMMKVFSKTNDIKYISLLDELCHDGVCKQYAAPGVPLLFDSDHFTEAGAMLAGQVLATHMGN